MKKINITRVLLAGIVAAIVFIVIEFLFEGIVNVIFKFNEADLARKYFPDIIQCGIRYQIVNILYLVCTCTVTIWLYACLCPKFGEGPKTALIASLFVIIVIVLFMANHINMNIFPLKPAIISLVFSLVEFPLSIVAGSSIYKAE